MKYFHLPTYAAALKDLSNVYMLSKLYSKELVKRYVYVWGSVSVSIYV